MLVNHDDKPNFTNSDRRLAEILANQLSSLLQSMALVQQLGAFNQQMAAALVEAVEAKDPYTRGHSERVNLLSMEIGRALGLADDDLENLHWGSLLHDVGKIGIPDAVLCKPGRLTTDEYSFIMVHPERSYEILRHIDYLKDAVPGARHHQEKFDGTGYPHGLKGERIPLHGAHHRGRRHLRFDHQLARLPARPQSRSGDAGDRARQRQPARSGAGRRVPRSLRGRAGVAASLRHQARAGSRNRSMDEVIARSRVGAMTYLSPSGPLLDEPTNAALLGALTASIASNQVQLVLDLGRVPALGGKALEIMLDTSAKLAALGGRLKLVNPAPLVQEIFLATGVGERLSVSELGDAPAIRAGQSQRARRAAPAPRRNTGRTAAC